MIFSLHLSIFRTRSPFHSAPFSLETKPKKSEFMKKYEMNTELMHFVVE